MVAEVSSAIWVDYPSTSDVLSTFIVRYPKEQFIREFGEISPPFSIDTIQQHISKRNENIDNRSKLAYTKKLKNDSVTRFKLERNQKLEEERRLEVAKRKEKKAQAQIRPKLSEKRKTKLLEIHKPKLLEKSKEKLLQRALLEEEKKLKLEQERQQIILFEIERQALLITLEEQFQYDFLNSYKFYKTNCFKHISYEDFQAEKSNFVQTWIKDKLTPEVDFEQATAIGTIEGHIQVVARAGSGKTTTLINRALFLQKHCGVKPSEILILAFNKKAVEEIEKRLAEQLQEDNIPHAMTFHALAYALVKFEGKILYDEPEGEQSKSRAMQEDIITQYVRHPDYQDKIRDLMLAYHREDWERIVLRGYDKSPEELLRYRRSLIKESIDGKYVKSFGEKVIADFLFEHNISYKYERSFPWNEIRYRPDFTIGDQQGTIIEYFGLAGDPDYDVMSDGKRKYWERQSNWHLLELSPNLFKDDGADGFCTYLKHSLESNGVLCNRLNEKEIWQKIKVQDICRFTKLVVSFIQRCRKLSLSPEELAKDIVAYKTDNDVEQQFLSLAQIFYKDYLNHLKQTNNEDFDGLMQKATENVESGQTSFHRTSGSGDLKQLRYILIDEYQDFSHLFHSLIAAIQEQNSNAVFFCVGDDWQAINGFAGSDLCFYQNFDTYFQPSQKLHISTNYRSKTSIVEIGNVLMQGLGTPARANKSELGKIEIANLDKFELSPVEEEIYKSDRSTAAIVRLVTKAVNAGKKVALLSRKNGLPWYPNYGKQRSTSKDGNLDKFLELVRSKLPKELRDEVKISTAHKYKGLQKQVVIVLDALPHCYPLLHPDWIFTRIFGESIEKRFDEDRRLFYVALTRAEEHLIIFTETDNESPFLEDLRSQKSIPLLNWSNYPPCVGIEKRITARITNQTGRGGNGTYAIKLLLKEDGYYWKNNSEWVRTYESENFSIQAFFNEALWLSQTDRVEVKFSNDLEKLLGHYQINKGKLICIFNQIPDVDF